MKRIYEKGVFAIRGDITKCKADAIGNAANSELAGGGGVDAAIHRAAGPELIRELTENYPHGCPTGAAVISSSFGSLKCKYVIHAVGPVWSGGSRNESQLLYSAYIESYKLAEENDCRDILMPAISTGVYSYPLSEASDIAIDASKKFLSTSNRLKTITFALFNNKVFEIFKKKLDYKKNRHEF